MALTQMADLKNIRVQALKMGVLPALLKHLNVSSNKFMAMQEAVADGVTALMMGVLKGGGMEEAAEARTRALPSLSKVVEVTKIDAVRVKLAAVVEALSPGMAK